MNTTVRTSPDTALACSWCHRVVDRATGQATGESFDAWSAVHRTHGLCEPCKTAQREKLAARRRAA